MVNVKRTMKEVENEISTELDTLIAKFKTLREEKNALAVKMGAFREETKMIKVHNAIILACDTCGVTKDKAEYICDQIAYIFQEEERDNLEGEPVRW